MRLRLQVESRQEEHKTEEHNSKSKKIKKLSNLASNLIFHF